MIIIILGGLAVELIIGAIIGASKGRAVGGMVWTLLFGAIGCVFLDVFGLFLGPIGWLIVFLSNDNRDKCPKCGSVVNEGAIVCKNCGSRLVITHSDYKKKIASLDPMANWKDTTARQEVEESDDTPSPSQPQEDPVKKLKQLKDMQDNGLITAEEYEAKRQAILSRM